MTTYELSLQMVINLTVDKLNYRVHSTNSNYYSVSAHADKQNLTPVINTNHPSILNVSPKLRLGPDYSKNLQLVDHL
ncbi:uncharacterized protein FOBCDRAFT_220925 [Fusarium oxysporum Fo47]|uniref:uncharacterized protein n=1 Tax=Fusarium oxysporum Fo47 TaxID=660027 RepID=UPI002869D7E3|nr:uncharacterized protein FOBCDRAFT_220925 [Fusarium oxysporum Fo47]WJG35162.1 hypothetical protein FOBCDRAFT_220925 [Fusarium oxysporum Fo47]